MSWVTNAMNTMANPQAGLDSGLSARLGQPGDFGLAPGGAIGRFEEALRAAQHVSGVQPVQYAQLQGTTPVTDAVPLTPGQSPTAPTDAGERAARGLDLAPSGEVGPGQSILDGLGRMRSIFDSQTQAVASASRPEAFDAVTLMSLQTEVVKYSVLVDVSSKLAGKATQALDSLMKGQ